MLRTLVSRLKFGAIITSGAIDQANSVSNLTCKTVRNSNPFPRVLFSTTNVSLKGDFDLENNEEKQSHWMKYNENIYPPQGLSEEKRPAVSKICL